MWTPENRPRYNRDKLRYPSDLTNEEWGHVAHLIPPAKRGGRRREIDEREVVNGLLYVLSTGCQLLTPAEAGGATSPGTCRRGAHCTTTSNAGSTRERC